MTKPYLQVGLVLALVMLVSYLGLLGNEPSSEVSALQKALPQTYLVNIKTSRYSEEGALKDVLEADSANFFPGKKESILESPQVYSHNLDDDSWSASADRGRFDHRRDTLLLSDNVVLSNDTNAVDLNTQQMKIDFRRNVAVSRVPVVIISGPNSTRADGMVADLDTQTVRLQTNVESIYVQPSP